MSLNKPAQYVGVTLASIAALLSPTPAMGEDLSKKGIVIGDLVSALRKADETRSNRAKPYFSEAISEIEAAEHLHPQTRLYCTAPGKPLTLYVPQASSVKDYPLGSEHKPTIHWFQQTQNGRQICSQTLTTAGKASGNSSCVDAASAPRPIVVLSTWLEAIEGLLQDNNSIASQAGCFVADRSPAPPRSSSPSRRRNGF